jgi:hypothetical protein
MDPAEQALLCCVFQQLKCPKCRLVFSFARKPRLLACGHTVCASCLPSVSPFRQSIVQSDSIIVTETQSSTTTQTIVERVSDFSADFSSDFSADFSADFCVKCPLCAADGGDVLDNSYLLNLMQFLPQTNAFLMANDDTFNPFLSEISPFQSFNPFQVADSGSELDFAELNVLNKNMRHVLQCDEHNETFKYFCVNCQVYYFIYEFVIYVYCLLFMCFELRKWRVRRVSSCRTRRISNTK